MLIGSPGRSRWPISASGPAWHPATLTSRNNLAAAYESAGRLGEAIPLYQQTLVDRVRSSAATTRSP